MEIKVITQVFESANKYFNKLRINKIRLIIKLYRIKLKRNIKWIIKNIKKIYCVLAY